MSDDTTMKDAQKRLEGVRKAKTAEVINATPSAQNPLLTFLAMQKELPVIPKSRDGYNFKYAPYEQIAKLAFPVMWAHGFIITHRSEFKDGSAFVTTTLLHAESGYSWTSSYSYDAAPTVTKTFTTSESGHDRTKRYTFGTKPNDQERGKSLTYGKRYNTALLLGLSIEGEPDRDDDVPQQTNVFAKKINNDIEF